VSTAPGKQRLPRQQRVQIEGPAGALEALVEEPEGGDPARFAVVCHPHPLHGGTLDNKVVYTLARAFHDLGLPTVRFNFRGVGASEGGHADGIGETDDTLAVVAWARTRWPAAQPWLAGFSFGGAVAIRAALDARARLLITVAPAVGRLEAARPMPACPWLLVQGDDDDVIDAGAVLDWASRQAIAPTVKILEGAGHFFHGRLTELRAAVLQFAGEARAQAGSES
jgi:uncharacterized protein